ncbi:hypothetical protein SBRCBS47491_007003 [Sporothrix bragantina]|uniref:Alpha/beta hydrolase fold-3 domain-containing protein n=1 Tax=Sporothrix bragantina TaxID=671064 RepID=A0ABP0CA81_9PEZI
MAEYTESWQKLEEALGSRPVLAGTTDELRAAFNGLVAMLVTQYPPASPHVTTEDGTFGTGAKYRVYTPSTLSSPDGPVAVYFHGGGLVLGDLDSEDQLCRMLAEAAGIVLVSIGYRLAPEDKAPAQVDDGLTGLEWAASNAARLMGQSSYPTSPNPRLLVIGISAGGGLALSVTRLVVLGKSTTVRAEQLAGLVALCPMALHPDNVPEAVLAASCAGGQATYSAYTERGEDAAVVNRATMDIFFAAASLDPGNADAFPALDTAVYSSAKHYPPTYIGVCENDPLRDDGRVVAGMLTGGGVRVKSKLYKGLPHCFWIFPALPEFSGFVQDTVAGIKWVLQGDKA